jgi:hypothetical protein
MVAVADYTTDRFVKYMFNLSNIILYVIEETPGTACVHFHHTYFTDRHDINQRGSISLSKSRQEAVTVTLVN